MHPAKTHEERSPDFDPNYSFAELDDDLKQLVDDDATPQQNKLWRDDRPVSCKEIELPTGKHARLSSQSKVDGKSE